MRHFVTDAVTARAPAKINLALHVTGRRADGFHLLDTLVVFCALGDTVHLSGSPIDQFTAHGPFAGDLPQAGANLALTARDRLRGLDPVRTARSVSIRLRKNLPVASGIGGGSSDAAATMTALARYWDLGLEPAELARIGEGMGADIPMCLAARPLIARGIGTELEPIANFPRLDLVLVNPGVALPTGEVFGALTKTDNCALSPLPDRPGLEGLRAWLATSRNDLEAPARRLQPVTGQVLEALVRVGAGHASMSGSGATCFGLFASARAAERAARTIAALEPHWFVRATHTMAAKGDILEQN